MFFIQILLFRRSTWTLFKNEIYSNIMNLLVKKICQNTDRFDGFVFFFRYIIFLSFKKHMDYYYYFFIYLLKCPFNLFRLLFIPKSREIECASKWINKICENGMGFHQAFHSFFSLHSKQRSLYVTLKKKSENRKSEKRNVNSVNQVRYGEGSNDMNCIMCVDYLGGGQNAGICIR